MMKVGAVALSALSLFGSCHAAVAKPSSYVPYELYNYQDLNTGSQRYWLLKPVADAPASAKPVLFGVVNKTATGAASGPNRGIEIDIQLPVVKGEKAIVPSSAQLPKDQTITLSPATKPILSDLQLSAYVARLTKEAAAAPAPQAQASRTQTPPVTVPDNKPDAALAETFGNVGTLIGKAIGGPIGIGIGSFIGYEDPFSIVKTITGLNLTGPVGLVIGTVIGYEIGNTIGGPIGDFIGAQAGVGAAQGVYATGQLFG